MISIHLFNNAMIKLCRYEHTFLHSFLLFKKFRVNSGYPEFLKSYVQNTKVLGIHSFTEEKRRKL